MKNIFKIALLSFVLAGIGSCTNDKDPEASPTDFELRKDVAVVSPAVLLETNNANEYAKFNWDRSSFNVGSAPAYSIVISDHDADPNLSNPAAAVEDVVGIDPNGDARKATLTVQQFNVLLNRLPTFNCGQMNIDIRIKSTLGVSTNALYQYSNPITVAVTGYPKKPLILAFAQDTDNPATAQRIVSSGYTSTTNYEGFVYLEAGNYRFYQPDACGGFGSPSVYGISGGNSGTVVLGGTTSYNVPATGHYFIRVNMSSTNPAPMGYTITPFNNTTATNVFGIYGNATKTIGFATPTPMTYDPDTKKWSVTISLINGKKFGFKTGTGSSPAAVLIGSNASTTLPNALTVFDTLFNTVTIDAATLNQGSITAPGTYVNDTTKTKYDVVVDVSNPRQYNYTLTVNPN